MYKEWVDEERERLRDLSARLVRLHGLLLARERRAYEARHGAVASGTLFNLVLRDEQGFQAWLAEVAPGKLRIIQRADGFELSTNVGKLPGPDPSGPSVPVRGGKQDLATLRRGLGLLKGRFTTSEDLCLVPSFGTEVAQAARALSGAYTAPGESFFETLCFVYPTPAGAKAKVSPPSASDVK